MLVRVYAPATRQMKWLRRTGAIVKYRGAALCPLSVLGWQGAKSSYLGRLSLCFLPERNFFSTDGRVDPAGFEPASATWTESCATVAPRARAKSLGRRAGWQVSNRQFRFACAELGRRLTLQRSERRPSKSARSGSPANKTSRLPASGLQHLGFIHPGHGQAFHRALQIFTDFK